MGYYLKLQLYEVPENIELRAVTSAVDTLWLSGLEEKQVSIDWSRSSPTCLVNVDFM